MQIVAIEPTPSPNVMKLNLDETLPKGESYTYTQENLEDAPALVQQILSVDGVKSIFHATDFLALERHPKSEWRALLRRVSAALGIEQLAAQQSADGEGEFSGRLVDVQMLHGMPMQVKVTTGQGEYREALPKRFTDAVMEVSRHAPMLLKEREWVGQDARYGDPEAIAQQVAEELDAVYPEDRLQKLQQQVIAKWTTTKLDSDTVEPQTGPEPATEIELDASAATDHEVLRAKLHDEDWKTRFAALDRLLPTPEALPVIRQALQDAHGSVRRLAVMYLGEIGSEAVMEDLIRALRDPHPAVRRTAGDALSDIGNAKATPAMAEALQDQNKLVRWRAARFLYEVGDDSALPALLKAQQDSEYEVALQAQIAAARIESGEEAAGTIWQQMGRQSLK